MQTKQLRFEVLEVDINKGEREECRNCPMFHALHRITPDIIRMDYNQAVFGNSQHLMKVTLPSAEVQEWMMKFDRLQAVKPGWFEMMVPDWITLRPGYAFKA